MADADDTRRRIGVRVPDEDGTGPDTVETLWASPLGRDAWSLDNSPFEAYSLSWLDTVHAPPDPELGMPLVERVVAKSGHRTVRAVAPSRARGERDVARPMRALGCTTEDVDGVLFAIDVPAEVDLGEVARALTDADIVWEHADPTYEALYGDDEPD